MFRNVINYTICIVLALQHSISLQQVVRCPAQHYQYKNCGLKYHSFPSSKLTHNSMATQHVTFDLLSRDCNVTRDHMTKHGDGSRDGVKVPWGIMGLNSKVDQ